GATVSALARTLPLFELKKFSVSKLSFDPEAMIDTLIRSKEKGSYAGQKEHNPEVVIDELLADMGINYSHGDLPKLKQHHQAGKRMMDFIIPDRNDPKIIIESSYMTTTSSGQGDKSKVELSMRQLIKKHYPNAHFWGFVDGIGWYVRQTDLRRMVKAYEDVFTFRDDEIMRFRSALEQIMARR
ncbi:MAG: DpnII family type II restriction endonuclease, partial [Pseudomonadota bacterium]|nr:DpnII family type II restriction endonuclease [Pseudomonadota bacterium]